MELMFGRPAELEMLREQIESVDDITAIGDEVRGIVERNWPAPRFEVAAKRGMRTASSSRLHWPR